MADVIRFEVLIIGGGIIGVACAVESAHAGYTTLLVEQHDGLGQETSSRNSEVVHSGIYYPTGSLKAKLCVQGNRTTYRDCERFGVWHRVCGKLIVAVAPEELEDLHGLYERSKANGVGGVTLLTRQQLQRYEPHVRGIEALLLQTTGIVDTHELMHAYARDAEGAGATIMMRTRFLGGIRTADAYRVRLSEPDGTQTEVMADCVINSAGLHAVDVARSFGIDCEALGYRLYPNRGHYFRIPMTKSALVSHLIYPIRPKHQAGLGIHITLDKAGQAKLGPDTEYVDPAAPMETWYRFDESRRDIFFRAVSRYFPALTPGDLTPDQVGVRPKLQRPGGPEEDFIINEERKAGMPGLVNLIGIESPGLTCAREIAKTAIAKIQ